MKKYLFSAIIFWFSAASMAQESLRAGLDSLLRDNMFETSQVALMVYDLTTDSALYVRNHRQLMRPASCMKLVTSITALDKLGVDYNYRTRLYYTGEVVDSTLMGNIYCVGGFDPTLTMEDIATLAAEIRQLGIDSIRGKLVADRTMKEALDYGEGWCWDDKNPLLTPLSIGRKDNFLQTLAEELARLGINLEGVRMMEGCCPADARPLTTCCHQIGVVLQRMMKDSDNFYAESMFYQTAVATGHCPGRASDARGVTKSLINRLGLNANDYKIADGSGLSLYNYVSAELLTMLLRYAWRTPAIYQALAPMLPVAGVDGTLKDRMKRTAAQGNVRAKTGTLTGISSLAGYCTAANGHELAFVIINQGIMRTATGKGFQDRVCKMLCESLGS